MNGRLTKRVLLFLAWLVCAAILAAAHPVASQLLLASRGVAHFRIQVGPQASEADLDAARELQRYFRIVSGARFNIFKFKWNPDQAAVWLAGAGRQGNLPVAVDWDKLGDDGFHILTTGKHIVIAGGRKNGLLYGVYSFLETYLGCRKYSPTVEIIPRRSDLLIPAIDDCQVPKLAVRMLDFFDPAWSSWHKLSNRDEEWGMFVHTFRSLVPAEKYFASHPDYFTQLPGGLRVADAQLCLTNPDVERLVVDELRARMARQPKARYWSVSQNDTVNPCACDACRQSDEADSAPAGTLLRFVNRIATAFPDKVISTLAYQYSRSAPTHTKPLPNVNIMLCSIECNRSKPIATDPDSASFVKDLTDWSALTPNILLWDYVIQYRNLVSPFPNLRVLQPNIRFFVKHGITALFEQGLPGMGGEFAELRSYMLAKLMWNPDADVERVMADFLHGYYGKAAPAVRRYVDQMHDALEASGEPLSIYGYPQTSATGYLSPANMERYGQCFEQALAEVAQEPDYLARVQTAQLPLDFARLEQAKAAGAGERGCFVSDAQGAWRVRPEFDSLLKTFVARCKKAGIERLQEGGTSPDEYAQATRQFLNSSLVRHLAAGSPVTLQFPASATYHHGEAGALTDRLRGGTDYHMHWLGFEGVDLDATIDLGRDVTVHALAVRFLQDINAWIFLPQGVVFSAAGADSVWRPLGTIPNQTPARQSGAFSMPFQLEIQPQSLRYIRVQATNIKTCPPWHKGVGGQAWIFADEIVVE
jgi:hypothetical protein